MQNGNDPMAALINSLPAPQQDQNTPGDLFTQAAPMFAPEPAQPPAPPQQPQAGQWPGAAPVYVQPGQQQGAPAQYPYYQQQPLPQQQPVYQHQPPAPQYGQPGQQQQNKPQSEYPMNIPLQVSNQDQVPAWAQGLMETVQGLQQHAQNQPPSGEDWPERGKTWGEFRQAVRKEAETIAKEQVEAYKNQQTQAQQQQEQAAVAANQQIDAAIAQLRNGGLLPQIMNPTDPNDLGKLAERELYAYTVSVGGQDAQSLLRAAPTLKALHDSGVYFDYNQQKLVRRGSQSAAAYAPIAGASPSFAGSNMPQAGPSNRQIANMSMDQLMAMGMSLNQ